MSSNSIIVFNNQALLMEKLRDYQHPHDVPLNHMYLWVKVVWINVGFQVRTSGTEIRIYDWQVYRG